MYKEVKEELAEIQDILCLHSSQVEMDQLLQSCRDVVGMGSEGLVSFA
jgi:hypothetical protein